MTLASILTIRKKGNRSWVKQKTNSKDNHKSWTREKKNDREDRRNQKLSVGKDEPDW